jgi:hypothetical protein
VEILEEKRSTSTDTLGGVRLLDRGAIRGRVDTTVLKRADFTIKV